MDTKKIAEVAAKKKEELEKAKQEEKEKKEKQSPKPKFRETKMKNASKYQLVMQNLYFKNIFKSLRYYFKHIFYILIMNGIALFIYRKFLVKTFPIKDEINLFLMICLVSIIKIILYGNTIIVMKKQTPNDTMELIGFVFKKFIPVGITMLMYFLMVGFASLFFVLPGLYILVSYSLGLFFVAAGDMNNKSKKVSKTDVSEINYPVGIIALERSSKILKKNKWKFLFMTIFTAGMIYGIQESIIFCIKMANLKFSLQIRRFIILCIWDIFYVYLAYIFMKLCYLEKETIEKQNSENNDSLKK
jgi:hypothetical protein